MKSVRKEVLHDTLDKMDFLEIYRAFHLKEAEYTFSSSAHGTFFRIDHTLGHKPSLGKFKKTEIISRIFSDHKTMRLEINWRKEIVKTHKHIEAKQHVTNNQWITEKIKEEIRNTKKHMPTKTWWSKYYAVLRGKFTVIQAYLTKQEKSQINHLTLHLKQREKEQTKPKVSRRKDNINSRAEINETEIKRKQSKRSMKLKKKTGSVKT